MVLGVVFVFLVCFLRRGLLGGIADLFSLVFGRRKEKKRLKEASRRHDHPRRAVPDVAACRRIAPRAGYGPILEAKGLSKRYGGLAANSDIDFKVQHGELRGIIGPNGAGTSTFFKMLTCEVAPTSGQIIFEGNDITGKSVTDVCQLGLTKSYQVNQLFNQLTVRQNLTVAVLADLRGKFKLDLFRDPESIPGLKEQVEQTLQLVRLAGRPDTKVSDLAYGEKRRLEIGLALATSPSLLLLDEPLAGMSPQERTETVKLLKSISQGRTMIVIDHDMDALFELAQRVTVSAGGTRARGRDARRNQGLIAAVQEAYLGGVLE